MPRPPYSTTQNLSIWVREYVAMRNTNCMKEDWGGWWWFFIKIKNYLMVNLGSITLTTMHLIYITKHVWYHMLNNPLFKSVCFKGVYYFQLMINIIYLDWTIYTKLSRPLIHQVVIASLSINNRSSQCHQKKTNCCHHEAWIAMSTNFLRPKISKPIATL